MSKWDRVIEQICEGVKPTMRSESKSDYIKREDAIKAIENTWINGTNLCNADEAKHKIVNTPAADVVEIRHGYWKVYKDLGYRFVKNYQCSECGDIIGDVNYNYCPNCGARMDGEEHECE